MDEHERAVSEIARQIKTLYDRQEPYRIYHGSTNSTRRSQIERDRMIDTSDLLRILTINEHNRTALVEPNVPMDALVSATLEHGLIPLVVMEFPGITVGGGFAGTSGESSSFKYGFFERTINWVEIILPNGDRVTASANDKADLFFGAASSFGTIGVTTLLEVQLQRAQPYVHLSYLRVIGIDDAIEKIEAATSDISTDFVDGIMYSKTSGVICVGRLASDVERNSRVQRFTRPSDPWFHIHCQKLLKMAGPTTKHLTEAIPLVDYLFRYDRGGFWMATYAFQFFMTPFNRITRFLLNPLLKTRVMYHALHKSGFGSQYVVQDVAIPYTQSATFVERLDETWGHYPLWLCPLKYDGQSTDLVVNKLAQKTKDTMPIKMLNFGVWGPGPRSRHDFVEWNRSFEGLVRGLGGQKWLYAQAFYTREEWDSIYDNKAYETLREKYHAAHLPSVFDKVHVDLGDDDTAAKEVFWGVKPLAGLYGVYHAIFRTDYLLPKRKSR